MATTKKKKAGFKHSIANQAEKDAKDAAAKIEETAAPSEGDGQPIQAPLIPDSEIAVREAKPIENDRMVATFLDMSTSRDKDDNPMALLSFSMQLTEDHDKHLPEKIGRTRRWLSEEGNKSEVLRGISAQTIDVFDEPKAKKPIFHALGAKVVKPTIEMIEETGKGKTIVVTRFKWTLEVARTDKVKAFGWEQDTRQFWITTGDTQEAPSDLKGKKGAK